jgi:hypothetical protein
MNIKLCLKRFLRLKTKIESEGIKDDARLDGDTKSWTRTRAMQLSRMLMCAIGKKALTGSMEIRQFFHEINKVEISIQDYFARRQHLNYKAFEVLNTDYLQDFYGGKEPCFWKGYIVLAIDGSGVEISNSEENRETFGVAKTERGATVARASLSCVNDVLNQYILDIQVCRYQSSEIVAAKNHIESIKKITGEHPVLIIFDRGYPSLEFINFLEKQGISYLIRLRESSYRKERSNMESDNEEVKIEHKCARISALKRKDPSAAQELIEKCFTKARIIETKIGKGKSGWAFITNLAGGHSIEEIGRLYWKRWNIEKKFHTLKNKMKFESNTGKASIYVRQDFWAQVIIFNMVQDAIHSKEEELKEKSKQKKYKYEMKMNENVAIGLLKEQFIRLMIEDNPKKRSTMFDKLTNDILKNIVPVRPDLPDKPRKWNKYKCNQKLKFLRLKLMML